MLSKMSQPNNAGGGGGGAGATSSSGRRLPLSLSSGSTVSRLQQPGSGTNGRSNSPQTGNNNKKLTDQAVSTAPSAASGPFVSLKKTNSTQLRSSSASSSSSTKDEEKNNQNGVQKTSANGKETTTSANSNKEQKEQKQQPKEKMPEKVKESATKQANLDVEKPKSSQKEIKKSSTEAAPIPTSVVTVDDDVIVVLEDNEPTVVSPPLPTTPTSERKSTRKTASQKSPILPKQGSGSASVSASPQQQKNQPQQQQTESEVVAKSIDLDTEMEPLTVDASPIRKPIENVSQNTQPAATSTPGRSLFGFRASSKQINEVELAAQSSISPAAATPRTFAQISGRRSIRPVNNFTPSKAGTYRCISNDLDTSNCTNVSMNATVGSEIPNNSSFSFSFFGRGRKRERTPPPPLSGSQSANDLAQDVDMSPPKRARFEFFSLNLASPFSLLRSRFSKTTISSPSTRRHLEQATTDGIDEDGGGEVQNVSGIVVEEELQSQQSKLNTSNDEVIVGQEAGLETPTKSGTPLKETSDENKLDENHDEKDLGKSASELDTSASDDTAVEAEERSRCSIM